MSGPAMMAALGIDDLGAVTETGKSPTPPWPKGVTGIGGQILWKTRCANPGLKYVSPLGKIRSALVERKTAHHFQLHPGPAKWPGRQAERFAPRSTLLKLEMRLSAAPNSSKSQ
jgi:hypothetical protein